MDRRVVFPILLGALLMLGLILILLVPEPASDVPPDGAARPLARAPAVADPAAGAPRGGGRIERVEAPQAEMGALAAEPAVDIAAQLADWKARGVVHAVCDLQPPLEAAEGYLAIGGHSEFDGRAVLVVKGKAYLPLLAGSISEGLLTVEGYAPTPLSWTIGAGGTPGTCSPAPVSLQPGGAAITGTVTAEGTGLAVSDAWVEGCGGLGRTDAEGVYYLEVVREPCTIQAMRQDGLLRSVSPEVDVLPSAGKDLVVDLQLPAFRKAGLGIQIRQLGDAIAVDDVIPGGAAAAAGLEPGDVIVAIDGDPVREMELQEFVELAGGQEGTEVVLTLAGDDGPEDVVLARKTLEQTGDEGDPQAAEGEVNR